MPPAAKTDIALIAEKFRELLHCWEGQPGRAKQIAEEITALLPPE